MPCIQELVKKIILNQRVNNSNITMHPALKVHLFFNFILRQVSSAKKLAQMEFYRFLPLSVNHRVILLDIFWPHTASGLQLQDLGRRYQDGVQKRVLITYTVLYLSNIQLLRSISFACFYFKMLAYFLILHNYSLIQPVTVGCLK